MAAVGGSEVTREALWSFDLAEVSLRELNQSLHASVRAPGRVVVLNPGGRHAIAVGLDAPFEVEIEGHVGYYCAGMNKLASVRVRGNCGVGVAENMMSGVVVVEGSASQSAGASARGGLLVIHGDASARCGISPKGADIVVRGSIGHMGAFMAQKGCMVVCGDAGESLGDSLYEARLYVRGSVAGLGADCVEKEMRSEHVAQVLELLGRSGCDDLDPGEFRRYGSARQLYNFHVASRTYYDVALAVKAGADAIVLDGMQGGTAATQDVFIEHVGIPILAAIPQAVESLMELGMHRSVQLIVSGGIRSGADVAKALALGADAVSIGTAALIALGDNAPEHDLAYREIGSAAGYYDDYQAGLDPAGISTQDPALASRLDPVEGERRLANYLRTLTLEAQTLARACGKSHLLNLEPEDLVALTIEAAAMARVPLAGTSWIPGLVAPT